MIKNFDRLVVGKVVLYTPRRRESMAFKIALLISAGAFGFFYAAPALQRVLFWIYNLITGEGVQI